MNIKALRDLLKQKKISQIEISSKIGMTQAGFSNALLKEDFKISTLEKIASALQVPIGYFFDENSNGVNGNSIVGNNNKQGIIISQNNEIEKLQSELDSCKELNEELRQRIIDKEELIELLKNK